MRQILFLSMMMLSTVFMECSSQPPKSPRVTTQGDGVTVVYGQPSKRDRIIFGELVPYGEVWRAGANEATEISFARDVSFAGKPVKKGTYSFFVIPQEHEWTVILNTELKQWGAFSYDKVKEKNAMEATVPTKKTSEVVEKLTYRFSGDILIIEWDTTQVEIPIE